MFPSGLASLQRVRVCVVHRPFDTGFRQAYRSDRPDLEPVAQRNTNDYSAPRPYWVPNADVFISPSGDLVVCLELSGMQPGDFQIHTHGNKLQITGKRPSSGVASAQTVLVREINDGPFDSVLDLPPGFDLSRGSSAYLNGTLRITIPPVTDGS